MSKQNSDLGNLFLIFFLIACFMLLYVYMGGKPYKYKPFKKEFYKNVDENKLLPADQLVVVQGNGVPDSKPTQIIFDQNDPAAQNVDGTPSAPKQIFPFAYNKCDIKCCDDSNWGCSGGCVCLTNEQKKNFSGRAKNNSCTKCSSDEY